MRIDNIWPNPNPHFMLHIEKIPDQKLFALCQEYGSRARLWRKKFAGLLPEVQRRRLYAQRGFGSIYEFAAKLAGMSEEQVRIIFNLHRHFEDKPILKSLLENGEVSANKLARVASIATRENQDFWANQARLLPKSALETLAKDYKMTLAVECQNGLLEAKNKQKSLPGHEFGEEFAMTQGVVCTPGLNLNTEVMQQLLELQQKGIDINELLTEFLEKREQEIAEEKEKLAEAAGHTESRYISVAVRKIIQQEHGTKCSVPGCTREAENLHHTNRFAMSKNHDPHFLAPLCKNHHLIAHSIDVKFHEARNGSGP